MKKLIEEQFDVVVIGAGPAGMMAAFRAAKKGARVALVDKKEEPGKKLLMAGGGRCNVTQDENNIVELSQKYGRNGRFLLSALDAFRPSKFREFLADRGVETKVEKHGKVYPASDKAQDVLNALTGALRENGITFLYKSHVDDFILEDGRISKIKLRKRELFPKNVIIATGGMSYPSTGSMGDGYVWAEKMGHKIIEPKPVLVPMKTKEDWVGELQGVSLSNVSLNVYQNGKKKNSNTGDMIFTHFGISGPLVLNTSKEISNLTKEDFSPIKLAVDFKPHLSFEQLDETVRNDLEKNADKNLSNCLQNLLTPKLLDFLLRYSGLDTEKHAAKISRKERHKLVNLFKNLEMNLDELFGFERAMVTSGGVSIKDIDSKTMRSKKIENLFFAGEIIDIDGPTGGYNLQACWSTGFLAGENAFKNLKF